MQLSTEDQRGVRFMLHSVAGFALMNLVVKFLGRFPATELVLFRCIVSIVLSYAVIRQRGLHPLGNNRLLLCLRGLFGAIALTLFFFTLQKLPLATAITIQYLSPIFTAFFAIFLLKERVAPLQWLFFGISMLGVLVIKGFEPNLSPFLLLAGVCSAVFSGLAYNMIRKVRDTDDAVVVVFYFPLMALPIMIVCSFFYWETPVGIEWLLLLLMGLLTQFAQINMTKALQSTALSRISGFKYFGLIFALGFDWLIFGVNYSAITLLGMLLVVGGVLFNLFSKA